MPDSPYRLTALAIAGGFVASAGLLGQNVYPLHRGTSLPIAFLLLVVVSLSGMYWAAYMLREDVANERWSAETLAPLRRLVDHPIWRGAMALLFIAMIAALVVTRHNRTWFWGVFCLLQTQTQIGSAIARPRPHTGPGTRLDWSQAAPLRSEHWGER